MTADLSWENASANFSGNDRLISGMVFTASTGACEFTVAIGNAVGSAEQQDSAIGTGVILYKKSLQQYETYKFPAPISLTTGWNLYVYGHTTCTSNLNVNLFGTNIT